MTAATLLRLRDFVLVDESEWMEAERDLRTSRLRLAKMLGARFCFGRGAAFAYCSVQTTRAYL
jgi:hypothetical protein